MNYLLFDSKSNEKESKWECCKSLLVEYNGNDSAGYQKTGFLRGDDRTGSAGGCNLYPEPSSGAVPAG